MIFFLSNFSCIIFKAIAAAIMSKGVPAAHKAFKYLSESPKITRYYVKDNPGAFTKVR